MADVVENNNEISLLKDEMYKLLREQENKLQSQITAQKNQTTADFESFGNKINTIIENNKTMLLTVVAQKIKCEKITELETFKNKVEGMLITHEIRLNTSLGEIEKIKSKYDKIISDNLVVPGYVGSTSQFPTLSHYISYNINEVTKIKLDKEQLKKDGKEMKTKVDGLLKSMLNLCDNSIERCKEYTDTKQKVIENNLDVKLKEFNEKSLNLRSEIAKLQKDTNEQILEIESRIDKLLNMKNEFLDLINNKYEEIDKKCIDLNKQIEINAENINDNENRLDAIETHSKKIDTNIKDLLTKVTKCQNDNNKIIESFKMLGINIYNPKSIANFIKQNNTQKTEVRENIIRKTNTNTNTNNILNLYSKDKKFAKYEILEEEELKFNNDKRRPSFSIEQAPLEPATKTIEDNKTEKNSENKNKKQFVAKSAFKEKNENKKPIHQIINLDIPKKKPLKLELNESSSLESATKKKIDSAQNTDNAKIEKEKEKEKEKNQKKIMSKILAVSEEKTKKQINDLIKFPKKQTNDENLPKDKIQTENKPSKIQNIKKNIINLKTLDLKFDSTPNINTPMNIINTNINQNVNNKNSNRNKAKYKLKLNEKQIKDEANMCRYVQLNLPTTEPITEEEFMKRTMNVKNMRNNTIYIFNNKLELPPCPLKDINKARNYSKNSRTKKNSMVGELTEMSKKMSYFFGKTTYSFFGKKSSIDFTKNANVYDTVEENTNELASSQRYKRKELSKINS